MDSSEQYTLDVDSQYPEYSDMNLHDSMFYRNASKYASAGPILPSTRFERNYMQEEQINNLLQQPHFRGQTNVYGARNNLGVNSVCPIQSPMLRQKLPALKNMPCTDGDFCIENFTVGNNQELFAFMFIVVVMVFICVYFSRMIAGIHEEIKELRRLLKDMYRKKE